MKKEKDSREKLAEIEKELIYSESENEEFFKLCKQPTHNVDVHITIPTKGIKLKKLFEAERLLREAGVTFDTGYGFGGRDWEFDWSLEGAYVKLRRILSKKEQICNVFYRVLYNGFSSERDYLPCKIINNKDRYFIIIFGKKEQFKETLERKLQENFSDFKVVKGEGVTPEEGTSLEEDIEETIGYKCNGIFLKPCYTQNRGGY